MTEDKIQQVLVMRRKFPDASGKLNKVRTGKYVAQGAHAAMGFLSRKMFTFCIDKIIFKIFKCHFMFVILNDSEYQWFKNQFTKVTVYVDTDDELEDILIKARYFGLTVSEIIDAGHTEFGGVPTRTAIGIGPHPKSKLDPITGHLPLF